MDVRRLLPVALLCGAAAFAQTPPSSALRVSAHVDHLDVAGREPMVVEHPDGSLFVASYGNPPRPTLWKSSDHGSTWKRVDVGTEAQHAVGNSDVSLAVASDGTLYFVNLLFDRKKMEGAQVSIGVSRDAVATWRWSVLTRSRFADRPWVGVSGEGVAHVIWSDDTGVHHVVSRDRGATWTERARVFHTGGSSHLAVGPRGELAAYISPAYAGGFKFAPGIDHLAISTDSGESWRNHPLRATASGASRPPPSRAGSNRSHGTQPVRSTRFGPAPRVFGWRVPPITELPGPRGSWPRPTNPSTSPISPPVGRANWQSPGFPAATPRCVSTWPGSSQTYPASPASFKPARCNSIAGAAATRRTATRPANTPASRCFAMAESEQPPRSSIPATIGSASRGGASTPADPPRSSGRYLRKHRSGRRRLCHTNPMADLLSDQPLTNPSDDALDRARFAQELAKSILTIDAGTSFVYSIEGDWGSGKSTILEFTKHYLTHRNDLGPNRPLEADPVIIDLSLWWFSASDDLLHQFLGQISAQLRGKVHKALKKLPALLDNLSDGLAIAATAAPVLAVAIPATKAVVAIAKRATAPRDVHAIHEKISALLKEQDGRIVIFLDDIDRLQPQEILQVFQVVKAIAALPRLFYVLSFDRSAVTSALRRAHIEKPDEYLEKVVQLPLHVPLPDSDQLRRLTEEILAIAVDPSDTSILRSRPRWNALNFGGLDQLVHNLRDAKRLANAIRACFPPVKDEVDLVDFIGFQALRLFAPPAYHFLRQNHAWITLSSPALLIEAKLTQPPGLYRARKEKVDRMIQSLPEEEIPAVEQMLQTMFPVLQQLFGDKSSAVDTKYEPPYDGDLDRWRLDRRICSAEYFDCYDRLAIPSDLIPRSELIHFLHLSSAVEIRQELARRATETWEDGEPKLRTFLLQVHDEIARGSGVSSPQNLSKALFLEADKIITDARPPVPYTGYAQLFAQVAADALCTLPDINTAINALSDASTTGPPLEFLAVSYELWAELPDRRPLADALKSLLLQRIVVAAADNTIKTTRSLKWALNFWDTQANGAGTKYAQSLAGTDEGFAILFQAAHIDLPALTNWTGLTSDQARTRCQDILDQNPRPDWLTESLEAGLRDALAAQSGPCAFRSTPIPKPGAEPS
jgi:predicted KAP-like P-loop ATPase